MNSEMAPPTPPPEDSRLWNRDVLLLWLALVQSALGDGFLTIGLMWLVLETTGSALAAGTLVAVGAAPKLLGPFAGVVVDRKSKRSLMIASDLARGALLLAVFILHAAGGLEVWMLFTVAAFEGALTLVYGPCLKVLLPQLVNDARLPAANSLFQAGQHTALMVGTASAGVVLARTGAPLALLIDGVSFLLAAAVILAVRFPADSARSSPLTLAAVGRDLQNGLRYLRRAREVLALTLVIFAANFMLGPINVVFPVFSREVLGAGVTGFGFLSAAVAAGLLAGNVIAGTLGDRLRYRRSIVIGVAGMALVFLGLSFCTRLGVAVALSGLLGTMMPLVQIPVVSQLQRTVPTSLQGKVFATMGAAVALAVPLGGAAFGQVVELWPVPLVFRLSTVTLLSVAVAWGLGAPAEAVPDPEPVATSPEAAGG